MILKDLASLKAHAAKFIQDNPGGMVVGLSGELGAGKTTLVRAIVEALNNSDPKLRVRSPSFVLHYRYECLRVPVEHFDLYRLELVDEQALIELGYDEAVSRTKELGGFLFVEWPQRAKDKKSLQLDGEIFLEGAGDSERKFVFHSR